MRSIVNFIGGLIWLSSIFVLTYWLVFDRTPHTFIMISIGFGMFVFASAMVLIKRWNNGEYREGTWLSF
jgi:hypothetical protein